MNKDLAIMKSAKGSLYTFYYDEKPKSDYIPYSETEKFPMVTILNIMTNLH